MEVEIEKLDYLGRGIGHVNGKVCFVWNAFVGEVVLIRILEEKKNYILGETVEIKKKSPLRQESMCPYSRECGGCVFDVCSYEEGIALKEQGLKEMFERKLGFQGDFQIERAKKRYGYRNKVTLKVSNYKVGFYREKTHQFVPIETCLLAKEAIQAVIKDFSSFAFREGTLTIRANENDEVLLFIETTETVSFPESFVANHKVAGIVLNGKCFYNDPYFYERRDGFLYKVSFDSFFQVNASMSEILANDLMTFILPSDVVLDLYCGVGYFSLKVAKKAREVVGIEVVFHAVMNAMKNKRLNQLENVSFHLGKVEDLIDKIPNSFTKVLVDPPRSGLDKKTRSFLLASGIPQILYVSCNPLTLVRDLLELKEAYDIVFLKGYDMFSYTKHVECVCVLNRR